MVRLIGFTGKKRVGKDASGEYLCEQYGFKRMAFADPLKTVCGIMFGLTDEQLYGSLKETIDVRYNYTPRQILQKVGTDIVRDRFRETFPLMGDSSQFWIECFKRHYVEQTVPICVTDVRYENEAQAIVDIGGIVVRLERSNTVIDTHSSELDNVSDNLISYRIDNNGTLEQLYEQLNEIVKN